MACVGCAQGRVLHKHTQRQQPLVGIMTRSGYDISTCIVGGRTENGFTSEMPGPHKPDKCDILLAAKRASPPCTSGFVTATLPHLFTCALACSDVLDVFTERLSGYQQILVRPPTCGSFSPTQAHLHTTWYVIQHVVCCGTSTASCLPSKTFQP